MSEPRFVVRELSGCYVHVLDTAECYREVFAISPGGRNCPPIVARQVARAEARRLNDWDAHTDAPLDFPRLHVGWDAA